ncbi:MULTISPECIES: autoinducer binding domain-containing protein [Methylomonas]|uniref:LuxR family transcriptional regulator n=2 Tax=Methylomonas TaxID=416 RepID=A0A140E5U4_9GAMM|nr:MULTISPECIES: autoinducer binding domain-containing protein [Methylomonas]AMK78768.1 LuxR family transcriptional regulator [Methylomonas denitrificans]OAI08407.1 LuxR family transcriptional regulator [Methylomonas methanica]TCV83477.1 LuxR family transcriptional regulator [Methylomonas methanica]
MKAWQEIQLQALQTSDSEHKLFQTIAALGTELGFDYCAYGLRLALPLSNPKIVKKSNYPTAWQAQYQTKNYCAIDPTVKHALRSPQPILWTDGLFASTAAFWEEARSFGLRYGWAQSMRDVHGATGMLTLARSDEPLSETELAAKAFKMAWLAQNAHIALSRRLLPKLLPEADTKLSNREIAVLRWTADGKTSGEIASIMKITERTVNFHISNAATKLNAANKTSAAVKAAMLGFL